MRDLRGAVRDRDEENRFDWVDYWVYTEFGQLEFTLREILRGGRTWYNRMFSAMAQYFYHNWDEDISRTRDFIPSRAEVVAVTETWMTVLIENVVLAQRDAGADVDQTRVFFSTFQRRDNG